MDKPRLSESPSGKWTQPDEYVAAMARKRTRRREREPKRRTQPEEPRFGLSTLPYVVLIAVLLVLTIAIAAIAFPGAQPLQRHDKAAPQQGVAPKGWLQEAQREFHK